MVRRKRSHVEAGAVSAIELMRSESPRTAGRGQQSGSVDRPGAVATRLMSERAVGLYVVVKKAEEERAAGLVVFKGCVFGDEAYHAPSTLRLMRSQRKRPTLSAYIAR